jgi:hypothetical protein
VQTKPSKTQARQRRDHGWLFRPGALTIAYLEGPRKPYISPFQLFLISNLLFFAVQSITHDKVFSTPLDSHLHGQDWSELARDPVENRLAEKHLHETAA